MIPKIIHYCWFGDKPTGELENRCIASWKKFFPDFELKCWGNDCLDKFDNLYLRQAVQAKKWAFVSDYVRLYALLNEGGLYFDTDEEIVRPLDEFMDHDFFIGSQRCGSARVISPALIGATAHNEIVKNLFSVYDHEVFLNPDGTYNLTTNPAYFCRVLDEKYGIKDTFVTKGRVKITENSYIYPYYYFCTDNKQAYAIHHYSGSWKPFWKVTDKFSLKFGKICFVLRKYKKNRDGEEMPFAEDEKVLFSVQTTKKSRFVFLIKSEA